MSVRGWLIALGGVLSAAVVALALSVSPRYWLLAALVPVIYAPFAYGRVQVGRCLAASLRAWPRASGAVAGAGVLCDALMAAQLLTARGSAQFPLLHLPGIDWVGAVWFTAHGLAALAYGAHGLLRALHSTARRFAARRGSGACTASDAPEIGRREFLQHAGVLGVAAPFAISLSGVPLSYDFRVEEREIELPHWPPALDGLRVAHLSDIHVGGGMDRSRLLAVAALVASARPDVVLHTGDFLTHRRGDFDAPLYEALSRIEAPLGQWASLGNHDFDDAERLERRLRDAGVTVLRDQLRILDVGGQPLEVAGLDFTFARDERAARIANRVARWRPRGAAPRLLLNHDPRDFTALPDGCAELVLSGHTHGGHVGVQLGRDAALTVVGLAGLPDQGVFRRGDMRLFVTRCVGFYGYPMRLGIPPEIALLVLRAPSAMRA
ncbi:MAG: metallophosphoesterase [Candidatus Binatia bacterium]